MGNMQNTKNKLTQFVHSTAQSNALPVFGLIFGAFFWGIIWYPYRLMAEAGISGIASSFYTYSIAFILAAACYAKHWRAIYTLPKSIIWLSLIAGWTNLSYVMAVIDGEVMRVMLLFYLSPLWTLILAHFWLKERTNFLGLCAITMALLGAFIMLYQPQANHQLPIPQNTSEWLALSSGIGFALTNVIARKSAHLNIHVKTFTILFGVIVMALLLMWILGDASSKSVRALSLANWLIMVGIAIFLVIGTLLVQYGVTQITATRASVIFLFELVVAAIASYFLAHEAMTWNEWLGGALIIIAAFVATKSHR
jgi:drug/metabolite transporter (DMT)-like permease